MSRWTTWVGAGAVVALAGTGLWQLSRTRAPGEASAPGSSAAAATSEAEPRCQFRAGEGQAWSWTFRTFSTRAGGAPEAAPVPGAATSGVLSVEPLRLEPHGAVLLARFTGIDAQTLASRPGFEAPMLFRVSDRCEVVAWAHARTADPATARAQQSTAAGLWFRVPARDTEPATGQDGVGVFAAQLFGQRTGPGSFVVQHRLTRYTRAWQTGVAAPTVDDSFFTATVGVHGWFDSLSSTLTLGGTLPVKTRFELAAATRAFDARALDGQSREEADYIWANLLPVLDFPSVASAAPQYTPGELRQQEALRPLSFAQVRDLFVAKMETNQNVHEQWPLMARFLEAHPEAVPEYAESLTNGELPSRRLGVAFLALGKAKVPEARDALLQIRANPTVLPMNRLRANLALADRADVGLSLAQALSSDATRVSSQDKIEGFLARNSVLALGMMVGARARPDDVKQVARGTIEGLLAQGKTKRDLSPAFGAMGNTGDPAYLETLQPFTRHADPEVRAVAAKGFRRLRPEQTEAFVTEWLAHETSPEVKREVFRVVHHQHLDAQQDVSDALAHLAAAHLKEQPYLLTRQSLVRILGPLARKNAEARAALLEQVKIEVTEKSGLYDLISQYIDGEEVSRALHTRADLWDGAPAPDRVPGGLEPTLDERGFEAEVLP